LVPTFALVWIGNDDLLDVTAGFARRRPLPPERFGELFRRLLGEIAQSGADMAVATLPDPTGFPALRPVAGAVTTCRAIDGVQEPVDPDSLVSLYLDPTLLPSPPCGRVITPEQRATVRTTIEAYNAEIAAAVAELQRTRPASVALVDLFSAFERWRADGVDVNGDGAADVGMAYLGGFFSLDGTHPSRTGNALIANAFIEAINARFGAHIPSVDVRRVRARDALARHRLRTPEPPPVGLIADGGARDPGTWRAIAERVAGGASTDAEPPTFAPLVAPVAGYRLSSGFETAADAEAELTVTCELVTTPVCTGQRACQLDSGAGPTNTYGASILGSEAYMRAYHRVDVQRTPSPSESCAPIIGFDTAVDLPLCSVDVCVQPDGRVRYRLRDRVSGSTGTTVGSPSAIQPVAWRRIEIRTRIGSGSNDDGCELRVDGATVAVSETLNLGTSRPFIGFLTNRQGAYNQPSTPGIWTATLDDIAITEGGWPDAGRVIARQDVRGHRPTINSRSSAPRRSIRPGPTRRRTAPRQPPPRRRATRSRRPCSSPPSTRGSIRSGSAPRSSPVRRGWTAGPRRHPIARTISGAGSRAPTSIRRCRASRRPTGCTATGSTEASGPRRSRT
jgi:hypothetical protein